MTTGPQRGFSLLELLVALFVVVIVTSLVTLNVNVGGLESALESRVRALADISTYALDEAQMNGVDMGLLLERTQADGETLYRYTWFERRQQVWEPPERDEDIFLAGEFPPEVELQLVLEDLPVPELTAVTDAVELAPQIVFYASGETTPGYIELRRRADGDILWLIEWDLLGRFKLLRHGEPEESESSYE